jgi:hypothetical protein
VPLSSREPEATAADSSSGPHIPTDEREFGSAQLTTSVFPISERALYLFFYSLGYRPPASRNAIKRRLDSFQKFLLTKKTASDNSSLVSPLCCSPPPPPPDPRSKQSSSDGNATAAATAAAAAPAHAAGHKTFLTSSPRSLSRPPTVSEVGLGCETPARQLSFHEIQRER